MAESLVQTSPAPPRSRLTRPSMLAHSMSLGPLPPPAFGSIPSGQRSVPASATKEGRSILGSLTEGTASPADDWNTQPATGVSPRPVGSIGDSTGRRHSTFDVWMSSVSPTEGSASLETVDEGRSTPVKGRPVDRMPDLVRGQSMPHVPSALGSGRHAGRSATVSWGDDVDDPGSSAAMESLRRDSTSAQPSAGGSPAGERIGRPLLNRAPGSRDNLTALTSSGTSSPAKKASGLAFPTSASTSALGFSIGGSLGESDTTEPIESIPSRRTQSSRDIPDMAASAAAASAELARRASQPSFVPFPQSDPLIEAMGGLGLRDVSAAEPSGLPRSASDSSDSTPGFAPTGYRTAVSDAPTAHNHRQQSLPASFASQAPLDQVSDPFNSSGWNPFYLRSPLSASNAHLAADPARAGYPYELRRDSGYGPSPPSSQEIRRGSYSPNLAASSLAFNSQLRRSQSSWGVQDAYAQAAVAAAAAPQVPRHPSLSFGSALSTAWTTPYSTSPQLQYGTLPSPTILPMDAAAAAMSGFVSPLLGQQQLRQSIAARHSLDYGQLAAGGLMASPFALAYGLPQAPSYPPPGSRSSADSGRNVARSAMLEEFRANRHRRWDLRDLLGHIVDFAGDQLGSRHIQSKLDVASAEERELVFAEVLPNMLQLSMDVFANYVVQKFFELGTQPQKGQLADTLHGNVLDLSLQMYGCRVIQKALEHLVPDMQKSIIKELEGSVMQCAKDQNANHVLQRSLERIDPQTNLFISQAFVGEAFNLATHPYGCRVLQRAFEHLPEKQVRDLLNELHQMAQHVFLDSYGNYIAQWIITDGPTADSAFMISKVKGQVLSLSKHKFASNVVEKAILKAGEEDLQAMLGEVLSVRPDGVSTVGIMLKDAFANFPLQKFLLVAREPQRSLLFDETAAQLAHIRRYSLNYGKYLVAIERLIAAERGPIAFQPMPPHPAPPPAYM